MGEGSVISGFAFFVTGNVETISFPVICADSQQASLAFFKLVSNSKHFKERKKRKYLGSNKVTYNFPPLICSTSTPFTLASPTPRAVEMEIGQDLVAGGLVLVTAPFLTC